MSIYKVDDDGKDHAVWTIVKLANGFYVKATTGTTKYGPFITKPVARKYAMKQGLELEKGEGHDKVNPEEHLTYPTFMFTYKMAGIPCADIVVAETLESAMKMFDFQWRIFDRSRPIYSKFDNEEQLDRSLRPLRITDIHIEPLYKGNVEEQSAIAE